MTRKEHFDDLETESLHTEEANINGQLNGIRFATSPDDINTQLQQLPEYGGAVYLIPGDYTDDDWSERIEYPTNPQSHYVVDMRGSRITLNSFSPDTAYVYKPTTEFMKQRSLEFYGPNFVDVREVESPPSFAELNDIGNSIVYIAGGIGDVRNIVKNVQTAGSGHFNRMWLKWQNAVNGYHIEAPSVDPSNDRSFYYGQLQRIEDTGVRVINGQNNFFYVQPENEKEGYSATGYKMDASSEHNDIYLNHSQVSTPLDIEGPHHRLRRRVTAGSSNKYIRASKAGIRPRDWEASDYICETYSSGTNWPALFDTGGDGFVSLDNYGSVEVNAGSSDGNIGYIQNEGRLSTIGRGAVLHNKSRPNRDSNVIYRYGVYADSDNYAMFVGGMDNDTNWRLEIVVEGVTEEDIDTGVALNQEPRRFLMTAHTDAVQCWIDWEHVAEGTTDMSSFGQWKHRFEVEVVGSPIDARNGFIKEWEQMGLP